MANSALARMQRAALAITASASLGTHSRSNSSTCADKHPGFSVITWNVLARPYTKYNAKFHMAGSGVETLDQTKARYSMASKELLKRSSDLVYLQECEAGFFNASEKLLNEYFLFRCADGHKPGTAVLVKKTGNVVASSDKPICVGGSDATGGPSKVATIVPVKVGLRDIMAISAHFTWDGASEQRQHHLDLIFKEVQGGLPVVLGGDFNSEPGLSLQAMESSSLLRDLHRVSKSRGAVTGLSSDFKEQVCIDHVYAARELWVRTATTLGSPSSPWKNKDVVAASDHVPVMVELYMD